MYEMSDSIFWKADPLGSVIFNLSSKIKLKGDLKYTTELEILQQ